MTYGFSKDHRPDLKQLLYGLTVTDDGFVPLLGRFTDGNRSDSKENHFNLTRVAQTMPNPSKVLVVADSKLFSGANLQNAMDHGLNVLTLLPKTVGIWDTTFGLLKKQLISAPILREVVDIIEDEDEAVETVTDNWRGLSTEVRYQWTDEEKERHEIDLRALVVYSTSLERAEKNSTTEKRNHWRF
jgi:transposase